MPLASRLAPASAGEAGLPTVRFVQSGRTASSWPLFIAEEKKLFQKNGIYLEEIIVRGGPNTTRAVLSNTIPIGRINPDYVIDAMEKGAKVKLISGAMEKIPYDVVARPEIKTGADLKGKTVGVDSLSGGTTLMLREVFEKAYKLGEKDYRLLVVGTSPDRYAALKGGSVQVTFMGPPFNLRARKEGFTKLTTFHEHLGPIQFVVQFANDDYIKSNRAETVKFLAGMAEASRWLYDPKNKEEALAIYMKILKSPREAAEADYQYLIEEFKPFPVEGAINKQAIEKIFELREKAGRYEGKKAPSYTGYVDTTLVDDAKKLLGWK
jgi:ABC-type nitrate/sulfonate/bicarbonate transport system substrate-binding protein